MRQWKKIVDTREHGKTLEQILRAEGFSKKEISRLKFKPQGLQVDGVQCRSTKKLLPGQEICLQLEDTESLMERPSVQCKITAAEDATLKMQSAVSSGCQVQICYEDADLLIVYKPSGLSSHPGKGHYQDNLGAFVQAYCQSKNEHCDIRLVGRLDKDTSGLIVYAKNQTSSARLWKEKEQGLFQKTYTALVHGFLEQEEGIINLPIASKKDAKNRMTISEDGKHAVTHYKVLKEFDGCSLVQCRLETGRTHQIRVHMAAIGHPIVGDPFYGIEDGAERLMLHAGKVELQQPFTKEKIEIERKETMFYR